MEQLVARRAHNPKVARSSRVPATIEKDCQFGNPFFMSNILVRREVYTDIGFEERKSDRRKVVSPLLRKRSTFQLTFFMLKSLSCYSTSYLIRLYLSSNI